MRPPRGGQGDESNPGPAPIFLDTCRPWRDSIIWPFNRLFWQQLADWEAYAKRGFAFIAKRSLMACVAATRPSR